MAHTNILFDAISWLSVRLFYEYIQIKQEDHFQFYYVSADIINFG